MTHKQVDITNTALLAVSLVLAVWLPFNLFLLAYAVLGPLHYLTEINWLHKKDFFLKQKKVGVFALITIGVLASAFSYNYLFDLPGWIAKPIASISNYASSLVLAAFIFVVLYTKAKNWKDHLLHFVIAFGVAIGIQKYLHDAFIWLALLLPTLIHVFVFTALFMWYGYRMKPNGFALGNCMLLASTPFLIYLLPNSLFSLDISDWAQSTYAQSGFLSALKTFSSVFYASGETGELQLTTATIKVQTFIAFAYTYHYLNWFSKTTIIGWKNALTTKSTLLIGVIWLAAVTLYFYNYKTGFAALFLLSLLHVLLEFPLNIKTIKGVFLPKSAQ